MMQAACRNNAEDEEALRAIDLLYDTALISSGFTVSNLLFHVKYVIRITICFEPCYEIILRTITSKKRITPIDNFTFI